MACRSGVVLLAAPLLVPVLNAQSLYDRAQILRQRGQVDSAYELIQRAADAEPSRADVQWLLGEIACEKAGKAGMFSAFGLARKCKAGFARAVELAPDTVRYLESLASYLWQAPGIAGGDRDSAMALAQRVRRRDPVEGAFLMAGFWWVGNAASKARSDSVIEALAREHAGERAILVRVAAFWAGTNRGERALAIYEQVVARDPDDAVARFLLGRQLVLLKREPRRAQEQLRFAAAATVPAVAPGVLAFPPGAPWYRLGQTYVQLGMSDSARQCFERALQINPQLTPAKAALDSLTRR